MYAYAKLLKHTCRIFSLFHRIHFSLMIQVVAEVDHRAVEQQLSCLLYQGPYDKIEMEKLKI